MTLITHKAPDFTASAVLNDGKIINNFNFKKYTLHTTSIIFFWPMDFTFVCPSELISCDNRYNEFQKRNVKIIGISLDSEFVHHAWRQTPRTQGGIGQIQYPIVADVKREIIKLYDVEHPTLGVALRASFLIDKNGIIRHQVINDLPLGRNFDEMLRMVDALQFHEKHGLVCPAQWENNKEAMEASHFGVSHYLKKYSDQL